uniref:Uncharacterized protein n=1 Tax=Chenopodium quinoa TaxID=63459 RepID=A0A803MZ36_CHEQI
MRVFEQYGVGLKRETMSLNLAAAAMCPEHEDGTLVELETEVDEEDFMVAFLIVSLGMIVCTTTNSSNLAASLVPTLVVAFVAGEMIGASSQLTGCATQLIDFKQSSIEMDSVWLWWELVFLMIFYLDHLHRVPNRWGVYPRLKVWDFDHLKAVVDEGRRSDEEFGFLPVLDIAYGEDHPLVPRDDGDLELVHSKVANTSVNSMADQVIAYTSCVLFGYGGPSIIECDGMNATQRDCYGVVGPRARLGINNVRMTSILYTKYWGTVEFLNRRKWILIDPSYAIMIKAKEKDYANLARKYCKLLLSNPNDDIRLNQIWMIDSLYPDPYEQHSELVSELVKAIDVLFQLNDPFWELGLVRNGPSMWWACFSCGMLMLGCIKHCARNGPDTSYSLEKNLKKRLFLEDANNSCNELLAKFDEILPKDRVRPRRTLSSQNTL